MDSPAEITPAELKTLVDTYCHKLLTASHGLSRPEAREQLAELARSLQELNNDWVPEYEQALAGIQADIRSSHESIATALASAREAAERRKQGEPADLAFANRLRDELLARYAPRHDVQPASAQDKEVWDISSKEWSSAAPAPESSKPAPPRPVPRKPSGRGEDVADLNSGDWRSNE